MANYVGKLQVTTTNGTDTALIGSTLYGKCLTAATTAAKLVNNTNNEDPNGELINTNYNQLLKGTTIHVQFVNGNTATSNVTLLVGTLATPYPVLGNCTCSANAVISFTMDDQQRWVVNDADNDTTYSFAEGTTNGAFTVTPSGSSAQTISVHGLGDSAYKGVITNIANNSSSTDVPTTAAVASYVADMTGGLAGLSGAMHFRGKVTDTNVTITDGGTQMPHIEGYDYEDGAAKANFTPEAGDVVLFGQQEYVWAGAAWELLGDESSYALKSSTDVVTEVGSYSVGSVPSLTVTDTTVSSVSVTSGSAASLTPSSVSVPNVTNAGSATTASVSAGILNITLGAAPTIGTPITFDAIGAWTTNTPTAVTSTPVTVGSASGWSAGSVTTIGTNDVTVVVPNTPSP